jgi:hypothetical protein
LLVAFLPGRHGLSRLDCMARAAPARILPGSMRLRMRPSPRTGGVSKRSGSGFSHWSPLGGCERTLAPLLANSFNFFRISKPGRLVVRRYASSLKP